MKIAIDAHVICKEGLCGTVSTVIINPITKKLTHVVVDTPKYPYTQHIVSTGMLEETESSDLRLKGTLEDFSRTDPFIAHRYIKAEKAYGLYPATRHVYIPYGWPIHEDFAQIEVEQIPPGELAVHRGAEVKASDGFIGKVDQFLVQPETENITHLIMLENHRWGDRKVTIPISAIDRTSHDVVYLKLTRAEVEDLPEIPIEHK